MPENRLGVCPACGVTIVAGDKVLFSSGAPGTRARLWARVCQYTQKLGCINQDQNDLGVIAKDDYYLSEN